MRSDPRVGTSLMAVAAAGFQWRGWEDGEDSEEGRMWGVTNLKSCFAGGRKKM